MERLTFVDEDGQVLFDNPAGFPEDVGFTIRELAKNEEWEALDNIAHRLANCEQRLKRYKDLEEQGKLLKLPVAVGDKIYLPNEHVGRVIYFEIIEICIFKEEIMFIDDSENEYFINDFGKTVFLTKEAAEAALKEISK